LETRLAVGSALVRDQASSSRAPSGRQYDLPSIAVQELAQLEQILIGALAAAGPCAGFTDAIIACPHPLPVVLLTDALPALSMHQIIVLVLTAIVE
jgi:hypothetical protein